MKNIHMYIIFIFLIFVVFIPSTFAADTFLTQFAGQQTVDGENAIAVTFSKALDSSQNVNTYVAIFQDKELPVEGAWILSQDLHVLYFTNIKPDTEYKIQVYKGLKSKSGILLKRGKTFEIQTRRVEPMISFGSKGFILASGLTRGLPVNTLNIDQADIDFFRVKQGYLEEFRNAFANEDKIYYYQSQELKKSTDLVYSGRWDLEIKKNLRTQVNIPITHIKDLQKPGIYFAVLKGAGIYEYGYSSTWFTISDLGVHAKKYSQSIQFHIQSLETGKPIRDVLVKGFNKKGKSLFWEKTNKNGIVAVAGVFKNLSMVVVSKKNQISLLPMDVPALDLSEFRNATEPFRSQDLFVYGTRDIYRPGELVIIDGLLRDADGNMTANLPIKAKILQPDGRTIHEFTWKGSHLNHYQYEYQIPKDAITGKWRITFSKAGTKLKKYSFLVAEFLPERMKLDIRNPKNQTDILQSTQFKKTESKNSKTKKSESDKNPDLTILLQGDFLYGAPAAGSKADAMIHIKPARELFKEQWPGYEFGENKNLLRQSFSTDRITLDKNGTGLLTVENQWHHLTSPHWITANASLYDSGGRPVVRNKSWQVWPASTLVGIRSFSLEGQVKSDSTAQFEVTAVDQKGNRITAKGLKATVIKEHREYYWEFQNGAWEWGSTSQFYTVDQFDIDVLANQNAKVNIPVKWGGYRLEIKNPVTGLVTDYEIWAGWRPDSKDGQGMNRPDRIDLILDKEHYDPNDTAKVTIKAPNGGSGYLFVESDTNLLTLPVTIPPKGSTVSIDIDPQWQRHDLYISAIIVQPGESLSGTLPKRAVGLIHLPLNRTQRRLALDIRMPDKIEPGKQLEVPIKITLPNGKIPSEAWVTLAAVDMGILNLTGFKTPSPIN